MKAARQLASQPLLLGFLILSLFHTSVVALSSPGQHHAQRELLYKHEQVNVVDPQEMVPVNETATLAGLPMDRWYHFAATKAFIRVYTSKMCGWTYFTTLKTASMMHREAMMHPSCGYEPMQWLRPEQGLWNSCGHQNCGMQDLEFAQKPSTYRIAFVREPIKRAISVWNYAVPIRHTATECGKQCSQERRAELLGEWTEEYLDKLDKKALKGSFQVQHYQPQFLFTCLLGKCMHGDLDFVGRADYIGKEVKRLNSTGKVGGVIDGSVLGRRHFTNPDRNRHLKIEKGTVLPDSTLLALCKLYWNDLMCFGYDLPKVCAEQLPFPKVCVDFQGNVVKSHHVDSEGVQIPNNSAIPRRSTLARQRIV